MTEVGGWLFVAWLACGVTAIVCVRDMFSPDKLMLAALGVFFADIFVSPYPPLVGGAYALLLLALLVAVLATQTAAGPAAHLEGPPRALSATADAAPVRHRTFWLLSIPALAAQFGLVAHFGGIIGYINALPMRVITFQGLGWLTTIVQTYSVINLLYFACVVTSRRTGGGAFVPYGLHLMLFLVLALMTGSRGSLLVNIVLMAMVYHHLVRRVSLRSLAALAASALLVASVLEVAREGVSFGEEGLVTGLSESREARSSLGFAWTTYGTQTLDLVFRPDDIRRHNGFTYLTALTNVVPRAWWPDKPDTGGVVLTKELTGDAWGGSSHLSTGILPEAIINFGPAAGMCFGLVQFGLLVALLQLLYSRARPGFVRPGPDTFVSGVRFAYIVWGSMGLIVGEFTNVVVTTAIQLLTLWLVGRLALGRAPSASRRAVLPAEASAP